MFHRPLLCEEDGEAKNNPSEKILAGNLRKYRAHQAGAFTMLGSAFAGLDGSIKFGLVNAMLRGYAPCS